MWWVVVWVQHGVKRRPRTFGGMACDDIGHRFKTTTVERHESEPRSHLEFLAHPVHLEEFAETRGRHMFIVAEREE